MTAAVRSHFARIARTSSSCPRMRDDEHALLRLAQQDLVRRHAVFAHRHLRHVDGDADVAALRHLGRRRRQARRAHVLNGDDVAAANQLERRLEQQLLGERIADLHARALRVALVREVLRRERRAVNAVASGARADRDDRIADALGLRRESGRPRACRPTHIALTSGLPLVRRIENDLAGDGRNADAVAVVADSFHDAGEQVAHARDVERSEAQRVEHRDRPRAHREHVAQNSADAGRRALIRLDGRRVIVRLDLERDGEAVADRR